MEYRLVEHPQNPYVECLPGEQVQSEREALDLVAACGEYLTPRLMLHAENLADAFFDLRSGLAGAVLLKFSLYTLKVAAVIPAERIGQGRFYEMVLEANRRNNQFHVFPDRAAAEHWLVSG